MKIFNIKKVYNSKENILSWHNTLCSIIIKTKLIFLLKIFWKLFKYKMLILLISKKLNKL